MSKSRRAESSVTTIGLAFAAENHPGAEVGQRRAVRLELFGGLVAAHRVHEVVGDIDTAAGARAARLPGATT